MPVLDAPATLRVPDPDVPTDMCAPAARRAASLVSYDPGHARRWLTDHAGREGAPVDLRDVVDEYGHAGGFGDRLSPIFSVDELSDNPGGFIVVVVNPGGPGGHLLRLCGTWAPLGDWSEITDECVLDDARRIAHLVVFLARVAHDSLAILARSFTALETLDPR